MNIPHFNAGRYIILCVHIHKQRHISEICSAREKERKSASKFVAYIGISTNTCITMYRRREKHEQKKHIITSPIYETFVGFCVRRHVHTHITLSICNKTTTPAFWLFAFLLPYIIYTARVCLRYFFHSSSFFCFIECHFFGWISCRCRHQHIIHILIMKVVVAVAIDCLHSQILEILDRCCVHCFRGGPMFVLSKSRNGFWDTNYWWHFLNVLKHGCFSSIQIFQFNSKNGSEKH